MNRDPHQRRAARALCGVYECNTCDLYHRRLCPGCVSGNSQLQRAGQSPCPVFVCARRLQAAGCHECTLAVCRLEKTLPNRRRWPRQKCPLRVRFGGEARAASFREELRLARGAAAGVRGSARERPPLPPRTADRMGQYLQVLDEYAQRGVAVVSSHHLARAAGVRASLVRKDLSKLGRMGTRGGGYPVEAVRRAIRGRLSLSEEHRVVWLGADALQRWPEAREILLRAGCRLVSVLDGSPGRVGRKVAGLPVHSIAKMVTEIKQHRATLAVVADERVDRNNLIQALARSGVRGVLNLTESPLRASAGTVVEQADLGSQLSRLLRRLEAAQTSHH